MMRKVAYFVLLMVMCSFLLGCANTIKGISSTIKGISSDVKKNWSALKNWDANFKKNWW